MCAHVMTPFFLRGAREMRGPQHWHKPMVRGSLISRAQKKGDRDGGTITWAQSFIKFSHFNKAFAWVPQALLLRSEGNVERSRAARQ